MPPVLGEPRGGGVLDDLIAQIAAAPDRRAELVRDWAAMSGWPVSRVYRHMRAAGAGSGRRRRSDAGTSRATDADLDELAAVLLAGVRQTGQATIKIPVARHVLRAGGHDLGDLSDAQLARLLRERGIDLQTQRRGRQAHSELRSRPNMLHMTDASRALVWYLPRSARPQRGLDAERGVEPYKNKPLAPDDRRQRLGLWRYVTIDHASGCLRVDYYQRAGESPTDLWDHLLHAWGDAGDGDWHGLPAQLWWDRGSEHRAIAAALDAWQVAHVAHLPGNPRAKGSVERAHHIVETHFEARLWLQPAVSLADLRARAGRWARAFNSNSISGLDCRLHRRPVAAPRLSLWQRIRPDELRELPAEARDYAAWQPVARKVAGNLTISFRHPRLPRQARYPVGPLQGVRVGGSVDVQPMLDDAGAVVVRHTVRGEQHELRALPRATDEFGFAAEAALPGEFRPPQTTEVEAAGERLRELAGPRRQGEASFGGRHRALDAIEVDATVRAMPRRGEEVVPEGAAPSAAGALSLADSARYARRACGAAWRPDLVETLAARWPRGATPAELDAWAAALLSDDALAEAAG